MLALEPSFQVIQTSMVRRSPKNWSPWRSTMRVMSVEAAKRQPSTRLSRSEVASWIEVSNSTVLFGSPEIPG